MAANGYRQLAAIEYDTELGQNLFGEKITHVPHTWDYGLMGLDKELELSSSLQEEPLSGQSISNNDINNNVNTSVEMTCKFMLCNRREMNLYHVKDISKHIKGQHLKDHIKMFVASYFERKSWKIILAYPGYDYSCAYQRNQAL